MSYNNVVGRALTQKEWRKRKKRENEKSDGSTL